MLQLSSECNADRDLKKHWKAVTKDNKRTAWRQRSSSRLKGTYSWQANHINYLPLKLPLFSFEFIFYFFCIFCCIFIPCNLPLKSSNLQTQGRHKELLLRSPATSSSSLSKGKKQAHSILWASHSICLWKEEDLAAATTAKGVFRKN